MQGNKLESKTEKITVQPASDKKAGIFYALFPKMNQIQRPEHEMQNGGM